jgi:hypothetical protein
VYIRHEASTCSSVESCPSNPHLGGHPLARCERAACVYARARAKRLTVITRSLAGYRTYRRPSGAYDVCGQSWALVRFKNLKWTQDLSDVLCSCAIPITFLLVTRHHCLSAGKPKTLLYDERRCAENLAATGGADLPRAQNEVSMYICVLHADSPIVSS